jgi:TonB dependent receptor
VQTKSGAFEPGGDLGMYGGSQSWLQPSLEYGGSHGRFNYFISADYLQNSIGLSPATPNGPVHDDTQQGHGFGYLEYLLTPTSKVSAIGGSFVGHFQIPTSPGGTPTFTVNGVSDFPSAKLDETQLEQNYYGVLSYLKAEPDLVYQISVFARYSRVTFHPDPLGDLIFNGIAQKFDRNSIASGLQAEGSYTLTPSHTLRAGVIVSGERTSVHTTSAVLPAMDGMQTSDSPFTLDDHFSPTATTESVYLQDAWRVVPSVTINGGLRLDVLQGLTDDWQLSPRLNGVWTATPTTTVHAGYARYFTPPPLVFTPTASLLRFVGTTNEPAVLQNTTIKPERAHYVDVGLTQGILPGLTVGVDSYYKWADHLLDDGQFGAPVFLTPFNYETAYTRGVELTSTYAGGDLTGYANLAFSQQRATRVETAQALFSPDDLAFIAHHYIATDHDQFLTASGGLAYRWDRTRVSVDFFAGSGLRRTLTTPNDSTEPGYVQVNLGLTQGFTLGPLGRFEARFDVINLLDNNYEIRNGTGVGVFAKQFGPPRGFFLGLKKVF